MSEAATDQAGPQALPPELAELQAVAAAGDAAVSGADLVPGAAPPEVDKAAELGDLLTLGVTLAGKVLPTVPKYFPPETCGEIAAAYIACAEKHGWTWHERTGGPEVRLGMALGVPAFLCALETRQWMAWKREQEQAAARAAAAGQPRDPLAPEPGNGG